MSNVEINKYFFKYNNYDKKIFIKELEIETFIENNGISSREFTELRANSHKNNGLESKMIRLENMMESLDKLYEKKERQRTKHINDFKKLSKNEYEIILTCFYLDKMTIKNISIKLDKSIGHIKKMKREALNELLSLIKKGVR